MLSVGIEIIPTLFISRLAELFQSRLTENLVVTFLVLNIGNF